MERRLAAILAADVPPNLLVSERCQIKAGFRLWKVENDSRVFAGLPENTAGR